MDSIGEVKDMDPEENEIIIEEAESDTKQIIPGYTSIENLTQVGFRTLMAATRSANSLPSGQDWELFNSYPEFEKVMSGQSQKILELISRILRQQGIGGNIARRALDEKMDLIIDANDTILERVGTNLDELDGIRRNPVPQLVEATGSSTKIVSGSWNKRPRPTGDTPHAGGINSHSVRLLTAKNIERPQAKFKDKIDNSNSPLAPRIKDKPNSLKPLAIFLEDTDLGDSYSHPYDYELDRFTPPPSQLLRVEPRTFKPLAQTTLTMVTKPEQLQELLKELEQCTEIAIDLEHHNYRSFQGITCLMQISTREKDYIVDTLELRDSLHCLNEVFTKPSIVKVFHGSDHDIEWLQRDLCLYVVNLFDTHQAARLLNFPHLSLAYLLKFYCKLDVNKHFQLADWRIRPLPEELILYAREDTHYLLYVYDLMKNALIDAANEQDNLVNSVLQRGVVLCKKRYMKPIWREDSFLDVYRRNKKLFDNRQLFALKEIYNWRDSVARQEDESTGYVLPNHMLLHISESLPREMQGILACCNPIPPLVRQNLVFLHQIVLKAREQPLIKIIEENRPTTQSWTSKVNNESPLHCPHDLTKTRDFRDDLSTLLGSRNKNKREGEDLQGSAKKQKLDNNQERRISIDKSDAWKLLVKTKPVMTLFQNLSQSTAMPMHQSNGESTSSETGRLKEVTFVSPYQRLLLVQPFNQAQEAEEAATLTSEVAVVDTTALDLKMEEKESDIHQGPSEESNEERIQRIKDHFMQESARLLDKEGILVLTEQTLRSQASKKRKRDPVEIHDEPVEVKEENSQTKPSMRQPKVEAEKASNSPHGKKNKHWQQNQQRGSKNQKQNQCSSSEFQAFDYSQVDFNRFKGGSVNQNSPQGSQKAAKFKNKNKNKHFMGSSNNKRHSFRGRQ